MGTSDTKSSTQIIDISFLTLELLYVEDVLSYSDMLKTLKKEVPSLTSGNFSGHLYKLETKGYVRAKRFFVGRRSKAKYNITSKGRKYFKNYLASALDRIYSSCMKTGIKDPVKELKRKIKT